MEQNGADQWFSIMRPVDAQLHSLVCETTSSESSTLQLKLWSFTPGTTSIGARGGEKVFPDPPAWMKISWTIIYEYSPAGSANASYF